MSDYFDRPTRGQPAWPRLFDRLKERREHLAASILGGGLDQQQYAHHTGQYVAVNETIEEMQKIMRGEDLPQKTELPEA